MPTVSLEALPYHREVASYLQSHEKGLWNWFCTAAKNTSDPGHLQVELLKSCYRLSQSSQPDLFREAQEAVTALGLTALPLTLWQAQNAPPQPNAALCFVPDELHIVFSGPVLSLLTPPQVRAVIGHELAHHILWTADSGHFLTVERLLDFVASHPRSEASHLETQRRWRLYTEIFCDRGAFIAGNDLDPAIAGLVKITTGLSEVSADGYLQQADELFDRAGKLRSDRVTHPEPFIRARALRFWKERQSEAETEIASMIEGEAAFASLDLVGQARLTFQTRQLLAQLLRPKWLQTDALLAHAKSFFADFTPAAITDDAQPSRLSSADPQLREYFGYVLLDFATADPQLDDLPLCAALHWAERLELGTAFDKLVARELKVKAKDLKKLKDSAAGRLATAEGAA